MDEAPDIERLYPWLRALASPVRLRLLAELRVPTPAGEIRVPAARGRGGLSAGRSISRPGVVQHLAVLEDLGLVRRVGEGYVVDQQTMLSLLSDLGSLARIRPVVEVDVLETREAPSATGAADLAPRPRLLVVGGPREGTAFALAGPGPWTVGRAAGCDVRLAHDPHVSRVHLVLHRSGGGFAAEASPAAKNPPLVDLAPLPPGRRVPLPPGALLGVGVTRLALQP